MERNIIDETKISEIEDIILKCEVCYVGMSNQNMPYVLPFNFGYKNKTIYIHSAPTGWKIDILNKNNNVCVAFSTDHLLRYQNKEVACSWSMKYKSVLAFGKVEFIEDIEEKTKCLNIIMQHYAGHEFHYNLPALKNVKVYKINIDKITGKQFGY